MIGFDCTVQEGCIPEEIRGDLAQAIADCCANVLGSDQGPVEVKWAEIPKGFGFRGGYASTTSLVRGAIPDGCDKETRAKLLMAIGDEWCNISGAAKDEVIISARDASWNG